MSTFLLLVCGLIALVVGAELLVRGASQLAEGFRISPLIVGLTIVAFGTSAPEMAVSVSSSLAGQADIALGNVVGSNIFNVLLILGLSALVVPLSVDQKLIRFDVPLVLLVSCLLWWFASDGSVSRVEGAVLFLGLLAYTTWCILSARRESPAIQREYETAFSPHAADAVAVEKSSTFTSALIWQLCLIFAGLTVLVFGASWLVASASQIARLLGVSELVIGLTIVAGGTSLPELATSLVAALKGERDIAVGNVVGSNLFNILGVLGLTACISQTGVAVAEQALQFDLPVMVVVALACLPVFFTGHVISRWEGGLFFAYYLIYCTALTLHATRSNILADFRVLMIGFVIPLTGVTLLVVTFRAIGRRVGRPMKPSLEGD